MKVEYTGIRRNMLERQIFFCCYPVSRRRKWNYARVQLKYQRISGAEHCASIDSRQKTTATHFEVTDR